MTELLITKGANIDIKNKKGLTPLQYSLERTTVNSKPPKDFAEVLISHGAKYTISDVVWLGDQTRINELLGSDPNLVNNEEVQIESRLCLQLYILAIVMLLSCCWIKGQSLILKVYMENLH